MTIKNIYSIGEQEPWRLTRDSAYRLLLAIAKTNSEICAASVDTTCPPTHANIRIGIEEGKVTAFLEHFQDSIEPVEIAGGASP